MTEPHTPHTPHHRVDDTAKRSYKVPFIVLAVVLGVLVIAGIVWAVVVGGTPGPAPTTAPATPTASPTPTPTQTTSPAPPPEGACSFDALTITLGQGEGAAGSITAPILFQNTGSTACTLDGYPTVAFVGDGNGTQLGAAAAEDANSTVSSVSLEPGATATATLTITEAGNVDDCDPTDADGFRVFPPGANDAAFLATSDYQACSNTSVNILTVGAIAAQ